MITDPAAIAKMIDHSLLGPTLTDAELDAGCDVALECAVASVCILPHALSRCAARLQGSGVLPSTTIGFPHGGQHTGVKVEEARQALGDGGAELDMVVNVGKVRSGDLDYVEREIEAVLWVTRDAGSQLKVIFETCYLDRAQKLALCRICSALEVDWVKTSTGFGSAGATLDDLRLLREHVPPSVGVKASGGIRTLDQVLEIVALGGVSRIGSSATRRILDELAARQASGDAVKRTPRSEPQK
jgi:deoxyribose-phosphate aldolase